MATNSIYERITELKKIQSVKERDLLFSNNNMIGIYQIDENSPIEHEISFTNLDTLNKLGYDVDSDNYELVYAYEPGSDELLALNDDNVMLLLDELFYKFNENRPSDYPGYSLSVGHVIAIRSKNADSDDYNTRFYFCDSFGFKEVKDFELKLYEKYNNMRRFSFTNQPISPEMLDILARTERGEVVEIDEINNTKEIKYCKTITENGIETIYLNNRQDKQIEVIEKINSLGSATELDSDGNMQYNGYIERDNRLDIVIGLPASGKSSAIVDGLSQEFQSRLIDNDMVKAGFTEEFRDGLGGRLVHQESKLLEKEIFRAAIKKGENIVFPKVGGSVSSILGYIKEAKVYDYDVYIHFVDLKREKVFNRLLNRLLDTGRYVEPELIDKYYPLDKGNLCKVTFDTLKNDTTFIKGYSEWNNDVNKGEKPILIDYKNVEGKFIEEGVERNERLQRVRNEISGKNAAVDTESRSESDLRNIGSGGLPGGSADRTGKESGDGLRDSEEYFKYNSSDSYRSSISNKSEYSEKSRIRDGGDSKETSDRTDFGSKKEYSKNNLEYDLNDAYGISQALVDWYETFDNYDYNDRVDDRTEAINEYAESIKNNDTEEIKRVLNCVIEDDNSLEKVLGDAQNLLKALEDYEKNNTIKRGGR